MSLPTDTLLARELHQAALAIIAARARGDAAALLAAQQRLASLSAAYRQAGHTEDELERAKAGGTIGGLIASITTLVRNAAVLAVLGIGFLLWLQYRSRES